MNSWKVTIVLLILLSSCAVMKQKARQPVPVDANEIWRQAGDQYEYLAGQLAEKQFPTSWENGKLRTRGSAWWCSGLYPGSLWYLFEQTGDSVFYHLALAKLEPLEKEKFNTTTSSSRLPSLFPLPHSPSFISAFPERSSRTTSFRLSSCSRKVSTFLETVSTPLIGGSQS